MRNYIITKQGAIGYGVTSEEAEEDAYFNMCRLDITNDTKGIYLEKRKKLNPWLPNSRMLHISGVGCLTVNGEEIVSSNGKKILLCKPYKSIYYYLAELLGPALTYEDITIVCRPEIDKFFKNISESMVAIRDMEPLQRLSTYNGFDPDVVYTLSNYILVAKTEDAVGIKSFGDEMFWVCSGTGIEDLAYPGYRVGFAITKGGVTECQEN